MKHIKSYTEKLYEDQHKNTELNLDLEDVKIWEPTESDIKKLTEIILSSFNGSEIISVNGIIIKVKQGNTIIECSAIDWCMAINDLIANEGEDVMRLFFWQGNNPLNELSHSIKKYEE